jgi:hypothetical protein
MRTMIVFFIALLTIPVVQVAIGPPLERGGVPVVIDRSSKIIVAVGKHLRTRELNTRWTRVRSGGRRPADVINSWPRQ